MAVVQSLRGSDGHSVMGYYKRHGFSDLAKGEFDRLFADPSLPEGAVCTFMDFLHGTDYASPSTKGLIEGDGDRLTISEAGIRSLDSWEPLPTGPALIDYWRGRLGKAQRLILEALAQVYPDGLTKEEVAAKAGYEANGGGFNNALGRLRTLELVQGRGEIKVSDNLVDSGSVR